MKVSVRYQSRKGNNCFTNYTHKWHFTVKCNLGVKNASASSPKAAEVSRAKNQLKASVALNLSTRGGVLSDLGTQVLSTGTVQTPEELFAKIDALTGSDIQSAATLALKSKPTVVAVGNVDNVPSYSAVEAMLK